MNLLKLHENGCSLVTDGAIQFLFQKHSKSLKIQLVPRNPVLLSELVMLGFYKKSSKMIIIMTCPPGVPSAQVGTCCAWTLKQSFSCFLCLVLASFL